MPKIDNGVRQCCLHLRAFVSMGEAFLLIFNASKIHKKYINWITNWSSCVLLDLNNPAQLTTLKNVEHSSWKWTPKFASSMAFLHKNGLSFRKSQHSVVLNFCRLSKAFGLYRFWVEDPIPTSFQDLASNRAPDSPIIWKIHKTWG